MPREPAREGGADMTATVDLAERIRREHHKVEEFAVRLHQRIAERPRDNFGPWLRHVEEAFERFRAHLLQHMALEEREGYLTAVVERRPGWSRRVDRLRTEHRQFETLLRELHLRLGQLRPEDHLLVLDWSDRVVALLSYVRHHENEENDLVEWVFTEDVGAKD
ncbi:MAG: hypothetical protein FLDDKLPJ_03735 [Phycisphaerae bacterium]|nr:hypothetical protein [Phycisphaerae bacterium]